MINNTAGSGLSYTQRPPWIINKALRTACDQFVRSLLTAPLTVSDPNLSVIIALCLPNPTSELIHEEINTWHPAKWRFLEPVIIHQLINRSAPPSFESKLISVRSQELMPETTGLHIILDPIRLRLIRDSKIHSLDSLSKQAPPGHKKRQTFAPRNCKLC